MVPNFSISTKPRLSRFSPCSTKYLLDFVVFVLRRRRQQQNRKDIDKLPGENVSCSLRRAVVDHDRVCV